MALSGQAQERFPKVRSSKIWIEICRMILCWFLFSQSFNLLNNVKKKSCLKNSICTVWVVVECVWEKRRGSMTQLMCRLPRRDRKENRLREESWVCRMWDCYIMEVVPIRKMPKGCPCPVRWGGQVCCHLSGISSFLSTWGRFLLCDLIAPHSDYCDNTHRIPL